MTKRPLIRALKPGRLDQELGRFLGIGTIGKMSHEVHTVQADGITRSAEFLDLIRSELPNTLRLERVAGEQCILAQS